MSKRRNLIGIPKCFAQKSFEQKLNKSASPTQTTRDGGEKNDKANRNSTGSSVHHIVRRNNFLVCGDNSRCGVSRPSQAGHRHWTAHPSHRLSSLSSLPSSRSGPSPSLRASPRLLIPAPVPMVVYWDSDNNQIVITINYDSFGKDVLSASTGLRDSERGNTHFLALTINHRWGLCSAHL